MGVMPAALAIEVTSEQQRELQRIVTAKTSSQRDVFRARIILGLAEGLSHEENIAGAERKPLGDWSLEEALGGQGPRGA